MCMFPGAGSRICSPDLLGSCMNMQMSSPNLGHCGSVKSDIIMSEKQVIMSFTRSQKSRPRFNPGNLKECSPRGK